MHVADQPPRGSSQRPPSSRQRVAQLRRARRQAQLASLQRLWPLALLPLLLLAFFPLRGRLLAQPTPPPPTAVFAGQASLLTVAGSAAATPTASQLPTLAPAITGPTAVPGSIAHVPILMYHYIREVDQAADPLGYRLSVTPDAFAAQLDWLAAQGYTPVGMGEALRCARGGAGCAAKPVALTFDDGYADAYSAALPLLKKHGFVATFYIVSGFVGEPGYMTPDQIRTLREAGMEIGAHSVSHPDLTTLSRDAARAQIVGSRDAIAAIIGAPVTSFCYPAGKFSAETRALVAEAGFTSATTTQPASDVSDPYVLPRLRVSGDMQQAGFEWLVQSQ